MFRMLTALRPTRSTRLTTAAAMLVGGVWLQAGAALACCTPPPPPPPSNCCQPPPAPPPPVIPGCCGGGSTVVIPGVSVNVQSTAIAVSGTQASAGASGSAGASVFFGGGGGGYLMEANTPAYMPGLNVEAGEAAMRLVAYQARRRFERRVVIQAVCIDDRLTPHPASQVRPEREVEAGYEGEVFRCIAGTRLQALIADYKGEVRFEGARSMDCAKAEALYRSASGEVACRPQIPERDCNERSLLRRYGAGVKILTMIRDETYTAYRQERIIQRSSVSGIVLDGGVGGYVR